MSDKIHIALCMGSSCFARGNKAVVNAMEALIRDNDWGGRISLSGMRCQERCGEGPYIRIDNQLYRNLDAGALIDIIMSRLGLERSGGPAYISSRLKGKGM